MTSALVFPLQRRRDCSDTYVPVYRKIACNLLLFYCILKDLCVAVKLQSPRTRVPLPLVHLEHFGKPDGTPTSKKRDQTEETEYGFSLFVKCRCLLQFAKRCQVVLNPQLRMRLFEKFLQGFSRSFGLFDVEFALHGPMCCQFLRIMIQISRQNHAAGLFKLDI